MTPIKDNKFDLDEAIAISLGFVLTALFFLVIDLIFNLQILIPIITTFFVMVQLSTIFEE